MSIGNVASGEPVEAAAVAVRGSRTGPVSSALHLGNDRGRQFRGCTGARRFRGETASP